MPFNKHDHQRKYLKYPGGQGLVEYVLFLLVIVIIVVVFMTVAGPQVSAWIAGFERPVLAPSEEFSLIVGEDEGFPVPVLEQEIGQIEFQGVPERMREDQSLVIRAIITRNATRVITPQPTTYPPPSESLNIDEIDEINISPLMSIELGGELFDVEPEGEWRQFTNVNQETAWVWTIKPIRAGDGVLLFRVTVPLEVVDENGNRNTSSNLVKSQAYTVDVRTAAGIPSSLDAILRFVLGLGFAGLLIGAARGLVSIYRWWQKRRTIGTGVPENALIKIKGIGPERASDLQNAGVNNPDKLLLVAHTPSGRAQLSEKTGLSTKLLYEWVRRADLMRISDLDNEMIDLLFLLEVDSVSQLARKDPARLQPELRELFIRLRTAKPLPTLALVETWVNRARELPEIEIH